jgi:hypothetical protein
MDNINSKKYNNSNFVYVLTYLLYSQLQRERMWTRAKLGT